MPTAGERIAHDPLLVQFARRAVVCASLCDAGALPYNRAIDALYAQALNEGLIRRFGDDVIQQILTDAFDPVRRDLHRPADLPDGCDYADLVYWKATGDPRAEKYKEVLVAPKPIFGALAHLRDGNRAALRRLRQRLDPAARAWLDEQLSELKRLNRTGPRHGHRRRS